MQKLFKNNTSSLFIILSIITGLIGAFVNPLMSYFLVDELAVEPIYIGLYTISVTLSGLVLSLWLGGLADKGVSSRKLYFIAVLGTSTALTIYINTSSFALIVFTGILFMSIGNAAVPQMLTLSRQWAGQNKVNIVEFNAKIRASMSFAWMIGPPLGFMLVGSVGFSGSFIFAIVAAVVGMIFVSFFVPDIKSNEVVKLNQEKVKADRAFYLLGTAIIMGATANIMYSSALPLYTLNELGLPSYTPGILMGLVAFVEIPVMLFASKLSRKVAKKNLMMISFIFAIVFYLSCFYAVSLWQFILLQIVNGIFYGLYAGIGLTLMQEQLPGRIGFTSAFYSNGMKIGTMLGTTGTGIIAQYLSFQYANIGAAAVAFIGIIALCTFSVIIKNNEKKLS